MFLNSLGKLPQSMDKLGAINGESDVWSTGEIYKLLLLLRMGTNSQTPWSNSDTHS